MNYTGSVSQSLAGYDDDVSRENSKKGFQNFQRQVTDFKSNSITIGLEYIPCI